MKRVIRLNENDIEKLVKKIISEESKSINEGPLGWLRKKFNDDEELGLTILKGVKTGDATITERPGAFRIQRRGRNEEKGYRFTLAGHTIVAKWSKIDKFKLDGTNYSNSEYGLTVDGEKLEVSNNTVKSIIGMLAEKDRRPTTSSVPKRVTKDKKQEITTSLNRYNLPDEERKKIEDPSTYFDCFDS